MLFRSKKLDAYKPDPGLVFNVHLDGLEKNHDLAVEREGVFKTAIEGIKYAKSKGFRVFTNTTVYRETDMNELWQMFELLETLGVDGHTVSPAYGYSSVNDQELFMTREDVNEKFKDIEKFSKRFPLVSSPVYQDFLRGSRDLPCTAWGNPTYNVKGWKAPCYLMTDGHYPTYAEMLGKVNWEKYGVVDGVARDPRCENCMVHCGYDPSGALSTKPRDTWINFKYNFFPRPAAFAPKAEYEQAAFNGVSIGKGHLAEAKAAEIGRAHV